jgi:hypothetical protein
LPKPDKDSLKNLSAHELKLKLMNLLKDTRVPTVTMNHFLQVMPQFEDAYKPNVATATSPIRLRNEESTTISGSLEILRKSIFFDSLNYPHFCPFDEKYISL